MSVTPKHNIEDELFDHLVVLDRLGQNSVPGFAWMMKALELLIRAELQRQKEKS